MPLARDNTAIYTVLAEQTLIERALGHLRTMGLTVNAPKLAPKKNAIGGRVPQPDAYVKLGVGKALHEYAIEAKKHLAPANLGATLQQLAGYKGHKLIIAEYIPAPLGERLRALGVAFADAQGNAWIHEPPCSSGPWDTKPMPGRARIVPHACFSRVG